MTTIHILNKDDRLIEVNLLCFRQSVGKSENRKEKRARISKLRNMKWIQEIQFFKLVLQVLWSLHIFAKDDTLWHKSQGLRFEFFEFSFQLLCISIIKEFKKIFCFSVRDKSNLLFLLFFFWGGGLTDLKELFCGGGIWKSLKGGWI